MRRISVLIPTYNRIPSLCVTLTSLYYQQEKDFDIVISDQSTSYDVDKDNLMQMIRMLLESAGHSVRILKNLPRKGLAQQRSFLLEQSDSPYSLFLDDDLVLEPYVIGNLLRVINEEDCGFAGNAVIGLSYKEDRRPHQQQIEFWDHRVMPEEVIPGTTEWERHQLHNAANLLHVQQEKGVHPLKPRKYKVAWIGGCVMYNTEKLKAAGGFEFWKDLPEMHCGEDAMAQLRVMKLFGGCGVIPSGVYHQELETTVPDRTVNAPLHLEN